MNKEDLIKKWLNNDLSADEQQAFKKLEEAPLLTEILEEAPRFGADHFIEAPKNSPYMLATPANNKSKFYRLRVAAGIAALIALCFSIYNLLGDNSSTIKTGLGENQRVLLPDNSVVTLNELSVVNYNKQDWQHKRNLELDGEAYFEVAKGTQFNVQTSAGNIRVLGTKFNVITQDSVFSVSCFEGRVQVTKDKDTVILDAFSNYTFKNGKSSTGTMPLSEPTWLNNRSVFTKASLIQVLKDLEKVYDVEINYPKEINYEFNGAFEHDNINRALQSITEPFELDFILKGKKVSIIKNDTIH